MAAGLWAVAEAKAEGSLKADSEPLGYAVGIVAWLLVAGVFIAAKAAIAELPPWMLCFFRVGIAFVALFPLVRAHYREMWDFVHRRWLAVLIVGGLGLAITQGIMYTALQYTSAVNVGIIFATAPIITMVLARVFIGESMNWWQALGSAMALAGVVTITVHGSLAALTGLDFGFGDLLVLLAAVLFAVYTVLLKREKFELPRLPLLVTLLGAAVIASFPPFLYEIATGAHENLNTAGLLALAYAAIPGGALMYLLYNWSIDILGAAKGGALMYLQMVFTTFLAWLILGEQIEWYHYAGIALILAGLAVVMTMRPKTATVSAK
jgi:drug/metabolite transporter (DMT)-like permease